MRLCGFSAAQTSTNYTTRRVAASRPIRALVIDDSAYNRVTLSRMLESHPQIKVVATAVNGEDGIKQVMRHRPDVITLDLEMPIMDGFASCAG